jgi:hypothetical protein
MKNKLFLAVILGVVLGAVFQVQPAHAGSAEEDFAVFMTRNDMGRMELLLQRRATRMDLSLCLGTVLNSVVDDDLRGFDNRTALDVVKLLVKYGADPGKVIPGGYYTPRKKVKLFSMNTTVYPLFMLTMTGVAGRTPEREAIFQYLLDSGADPNAKNGSGGLTALTNAAALGKVNMVKMLVEHGANVNLRLETGETPLSLAYEKGEIEIHNYLKAHGAIEFPPRPAAAAPAPDTAATRRAARRASASGNSGAKAGATAELVVDVLKFFFN